MIELERKYLAKTLPKNLKECKSKEVIDIYFPKSAAHPSLRLRKNGDKYEMTKKEPLSQDDTSEFLEQTIILRQDEFNEFNKLEGKKVHKIRYYYDYNGYTAEIDVFQGALKGLVVVEFEFPNREEKNNFTMPDFCLLELNEGDFKAAGGVLCGKSYEDIAHELDKLNYKQIFLE